MQKYLACFLLEIAFFHNNKKIAGFCANKADSLRAFKQ